MNVKKKRNISIVSFGVLAISFLFIFNANIYVIDLLPDIFGYVILSLALVKLSDLCEDIAVSSKFFRYMILSELGKLAALLWLFGLSSNDERNTGILLVGFAFAVIDSILLFIAYGRLFSGLISLGFAHKNTAVLGSRREGRKSYTERIRALTLFFVIFKAAMSVLPEFSNLASYEYDESSGLVDLYEYIGLMRGMSFFITTIVGVFWLVSIIRYFLRLRKDTEFIESLAENYRERILPKKGLFVRRSFSTSFFFLVVASVFLFDMRVDGFNIIPDTVGAILFFVGMMLSFKQLKVKKAPFVSCGIFYLLASIAAYVTEFFFYFNGYRLSSIYRTEKVYNAYIAMSAASVAQTVGFLAMTAAMLLMMRSIIKEHTGFVYGNDPQRDRERLEKYHKESQKKLWFIAVTAILVALSDVFYTFFAARFVYAGFFGVLATFIFLVSVIRTTSLLKDEIDTKYMLD